MSVQAGRDPSRPACPAREPRRRPGGLGARPTRADRAPGGRRLRRPGPERLHAALPQRLLHRARPEHGDGAARRLRRPRHAAQRRGQADRPDRLEPRRRLQPGLADRHQGAGARHARGFQADGICAHHRHGAQLRPRRAGGPARRRHRPPRAHLDRARHVRRPSRPDLPHPPGQEPARGPPLHRRDARHARRERQAHPAHGVLQGAARRVTAGRPRPRRPLRRPLPHAEARGHRPLEPLPRLGLHRGERALAGRAHAGHPQRRLRAARRQESRRRPAARPRTRSSRSGPTGCRCRSRATS